MAAKGLVCARALIACTHSMHSIHMISKTSSVNCFLYMFGGLLCVRAGARLEPGWKADTSSTDRFQSVSAVASERASLNLARALMETLSQGECFVSPDR